MRGKHENEKNEMRDTKKNTRQALIYFMSLMGRSIAYSNGSFKMYKAEVMEAIRNDTSNE